jgi:hypothetical protein
MGRLERMRTALRELERLAESARDHEAAESSLAEGRALLARVWLLADLRLAAGRRCEMKHWTSWEG